MKPKNTLEIPAHDPSGFDIGALKRALANRLTYTVGKDGYTATDRDWLDTLCYAVRDRLIEGWMETQRSYYHSDVKRVYYLSLEFLIGRTLYNALLNLEIDEPARKALAEIGLDLEALREQEFEAGLGNGGLGRLAACFLDSMATLGIPGAGYGIRYEYGMFHQNIENGEQTESSDPWLRFGNPWEFPRPEVIYPVHFNGHVNHFRDQQGHTHHYWVDTEVVNAMAYDTPVPGYGNDTVNNLRLWSAKATHDFDLRLLQFRKLHQRGRGKDRVGKHLQGALPERQHGRRTRPCGSSRNISSSVPRCRTSCFATSKRTKVSMRCRTRSRSSSTTPTRPSPSPS